MTSRLFNNKRAVSPLIATVILIAFAVSLGAVVMNLGSNFATNDPLANQKECVGMGLKFHDLNGPQITFSGSGADGFVEFVVDHVGTEPIPKVRFRISAAKGGSTQTFISDLENSAIEPGYPLSKRVAYNYDTYGIPKQVEVIPTAQRNGKDLFCFKNSATYTLP
ncbi:MAG: archaellin/type IV pilin N-terminal domain-containing protein [Nanoarchaeota archaeon]